MAKRFFDTEIWKEDWFLNLKKEYMLFWFYILHQCDHSGMYKPNKNQFEFFTQSKIDLIEFLNNINDQKDRIIVLQNNRWFIADFVTFQYGDTLNHNNRMHLSIIKKLKENNINLTSIRGLKEVKDTLKEKDKEKEKEKVISSNTSICNSNTNMYIDINTAEVFEELWKKYPKKVEKKKALSEFKKSVKNKSDVEDIKKALENYLEMLRVEDWRKPKDACRWFRDDFWRSFIDQQNTSNKSAADIILEKYKKGNEL